MPDGETVRTAHGFFRCTVSVSQICVHDTELGLERIGLPGICHRILASILLIGFSYQSHVLFSMICPALLSLYAPEVLFGQYRRGASPRDDVQSANRSTCTCWSLEDKLSTFDHRFAGIDGPDDFFLQVGTVGDFALEQSLTTNRLLSPSSQ